MKTNLLSAGRRYLALVSEAQRRHSLSFPEHSACFWDARSLGRQLALPDTDLAPVLLFLAEQGFLEVKGPESRNPTVVVTEKGLEWEHHLDAFGPAPTQPDLRMETAFFRRLPKEARIAYRPIVLALLGLIIGSGGLVLIHLSRTLSTKDAGAGLVPMGLGVATVLLGGILIGSNLRKAKASIKAHFRQSRPTPSSYL